MGRNISKSCFTLHCKREWKCLPFVLANFNFATSCSVPKVDAVKQIGPHPTGKGSICAIETTNGRVAPTKPAKLSNVTCVLSSIIRFRCPSFAKAPIYSLMCTWKLSYAYHTYLSALPPHLRLAFINHELTPSRSSFLVKTYTKKFYNSSAVVISVENGWLAAIQKFHEYLRGLQSFLDGTYFS